MKVKIMSILPVKTLFSTAEKTYKRPGLKMWECKTEKKDQKLS